MTENWLCRVQINYITCGSLLSYKAGISVPFYKIIINNVHNIMSLLFFTI